MKAVKLKYQNKWTTGEESKIKITWIELLEELLKLGKINLFLSKGAAKKYLEPFIGSDYKRYLLEFKSNPQDEKMIVCLLSETDFDMKLSPMELGNVDYNYLILVKDTVKTTIFGIALTEIPPIIAESLNLELKSDYLQRGLQFRESIREIIRYLKSKMH